MQASGQMIYCNGMDTFNPTEYLTLPAGPEQNFASTSKSGQPQCMTGTVKFEKIGLDLDVNIFVNSKIMKFICTILKHDLVVNKGIFNTFKYTKICIYSFTARSIESPMNIYHVVKCFHLPLI